MIPILDLKKYCDQNLISYETVGERCIRINNFLYEIVDSEVRIFDEEFEFIPMSMNENIDGFIYLFVGRWYLYRFDDEEFDLNELRYEGECKAKMKTNSFIGVHSGNEILNGVGLYLEWIKKAKFLGIKNLGICEKKSLSGVIDFQKLCIKNDIKPIFGMSISITSNRGDYEVKVYCKDFSGWQNMLKYNEILNIQEKNYIEEQYLKNNSDGLYIIIDPKYSDYSLTPSFIKHYLLDTVIFEDEELDESYILNLEKFIRSNMLPISSYDAYYPNKEDWEVREKLWGISKTFDYRTKNQYLKSNDEYAKEFIVMFEKEDRSWIEIFKSAIKNLDDIVDSCNFIYDTTSRHLPKYKMTEEESELFESNEKLFLSLIKKGFKNKNIPIEKRKIYLDRLQEEINVLKAGDVIDYFLILHDIIKFAKSKDILIGIGRGSAGGSLVSYLLDIIQLDPLEFDLLFSRFLNPGRMGSFEECKAYEILVNNSDTDKDETIVLNEKSLVRVGVNYSPETKPIFIEDLFEGQYLTKPIEGYVKSIRKTKGLRLEGGTLPDIDTDFESSRRSEVKDYMEERFGQKQVVSVGTVNTLQLKGTLKDFDRQLDNNVSLANMMTSIIDAKDSSMLDLYRRAAKEPKLKEYIKKNTDIFYYIPSVLDQPKTKSIHPCAVVIVPDSLTSNEWIPTRMQKGLVVSEWNGGEMESAGFLKEDILGIKQLDKFSDILKLIKSNGKKVPNIYNLPYDKEAYRYFSNGWNADVFQMGTDSLSAYTKYLKPRDMNDLTAIISLHRPGPMENHYHNIYVQCKNEGRKPEFLWGTEEITKNTFGLIVYQEQVMAVCQQLGNLTMQEADDVRRAMGKKSQKILAEWKGKVKEGFMKNGSTESNFEKTWLVMMEFAKYSFNKSHATAYAMTGYICQWLKVNYPLEYWTVALDYADEDKGLKFLSEIFESKGIQVANPDINASGISMISDQDTNKIFWGIESIKGIGEATAEQIIGLREKDGLYKSFADFYFRNKFKGSKVKKQTFEALITSGAFDIMYGFEGNEERRYNLLRRFRVYDKTRISNPARDLYINGETSNRWWWLLQQKKMTGLVFLDYEKICKSVGIEAQFANEFDINTRQTRGINRSFGGYLIESKIRNSKKGKFAVLQIENNYRLFKVILWNEEYLRYKDVLLGAEKSLVVFNAEMKYEDKWVKGNQFTLQENSDFYVLG